MTRSPIKTRKGIPTEEQEQRTLAQYLDVRGFLWCHVPNGGARHRAEGGKLKAAGCKSGVPDVLIFDHPKNEEIAIGCAIELKRPKGGRVSQEQWAWIAALRDRGWLTHVCYGADHAIRVIESLYD